MTTFEKELLELRDKSLIENPNPVGSTELLDLEWKTMDGHIKVRDMDRQHCVNSMKTIDKWDALYQSGGDKTKRSRRTLRSERNQRRNVKLREAMQIRINILDAQNKADLLPQTMHKAVVKFVSDNHITTVLGRN